MFLTHVIDVKKQRSVVTVQEGPHLQQQAMMEIILSGNFEKYNAYLFNLKNNLSLFKMTLRAETKL